MKRRVYEFNGVAVEQFSDSTDIFEKHFFVHENGSRDGRFYRQLKDAILKAKSYWTDPGFLVGRYHDHHRVETDAGRRAIEAAKLAA
jgi:hypothetical protein